MIAEAYVALAQEPWGMKPWEIARLTDWQIEHLYLRPAVERAKKLKQDIPEAHGSAIHEPVPDEPVTPEPGTPAFRFWCINKFVQFGLSHQDAVAQFERQNAEWLSQQVR